MNKTVVVLLLMVALAGLLAFVAIAHPNGDMCPRSYPARLTC